MQYNKQQFNKVKDKKMMKKVKKQWVVVSVATLAFLGTTAYTMGGTTAHAADGSNGTNPAPSNSNSGNTQNSGNGGTTTNQQSGGSGNAATNTNAASTNGTSASSGASASAPVVTVGTTNGQAPSFNNNDESASYSQQIQQGYSDAFNGKGNNSNNLTGQAVNYYNAAYNGAQAAMNAYNQSTNGYGAGTQDYTYYGNTPVRRNDNGTTANASLAVPSGTPSAAAAASLQSSDPVSGATMSAQAIIDGTPQSYGSSDSPYRGGANNPIEATNSVNKYETTLLNKLNNPNNVSVQLPTNNITVPDQNNQAITQAEQMYANYAGLNKAFQAGANMALAQQGINDAESGKWTGISAGTTTNTDFYLQSNTQQTNNPYDQAYRGAKAAIASTFTNDLYNGNSSIQAKIASSNTDYYTQGYNDVVTQSQSGTAFISNGQQFYSVLTGLTNSISGAGGTISSNVNNIRLVGDVGLTGSGASGFNDKTAISTNISSLTVDGQNHLMDFNGMNYLLNGNSLKDLYVKNFQTLYGSNYYGPFILGGTGSIHYSNINYVGPQLISAYSNDVYFSGNVNILNPYDINPTNFTRNYNYTPYQPSGDGIEGSGNQENLEVNNFVLEDGAHYFGAVSPDKGGTNIIVQGNFTLGQNSKMTLLTRDSHGAAEGAYDGANYGIYLSSGGTNNKPSLNVLKNAVLNLIGGQSSTSNYIGSGIVTDGGVNSTINVDGGTINYQGSNGVPGYYGQVFDFKGSTTINVINGGLIKVLLANAPSSSNNVNYNTGGSPSKQVSFGGLINNNNAGNPQSANFNVANGGNLIVGLYDNGGGYVIPYYGNLNMNSVGPDNAVFLTNNSTGAFQTNSGSNGQTFSGSITAYNVAVTTAGSTTPTAFYKFQLNSGSQTFTGVRSDGTPVSGSISDSHKLIISNLPSVQFVGNLQTSYDSQGNEVITANAKISNYSGNYSRIYYGVGYSNSNPNGNFNSLTSYTTSGGIKNTTPGLADNNTYYGFQNVPSNYDGSIIPITFILPKSVVTNPAYVGMRLKYGLASVTNVLGSSGSTTNIEGYSLNNNNQLAQDSNGSFQIGTSDLTKQTLGTSDALTDLVNNNTSAKSSRDFNTQTNTDYSVSYTSAKSGYQAFDINNPLSDTQIKQSSSYINSPNPTAYIQGYHRALYDAGVRDGRNGITTQSLSSMPDYQAGMNQYVSAYTAALSTNNLGLDANTIISKSNLPTSYLGAPATGTTAGIADATGASDFVQDERNGTIQAANSKYAAITDPNRQSAYLDAEAGYFAAVNNQKLDATASRAKQAGYQYAKSLIAGAMSQSQPTQSNTDPSLNFSAVQDGYNAAQAAISQAVSNLGSSNQEVQLTSHDALSDDGFLGDRTVYKSIKYGYYQGAKNQSDVNLIGQTETKLDQIEEVGYVAYVQPLAYSAGANSYNTKGSNTPTSPYNNSTIGQQSYTNGYNDAQTAFNQGQSDGLTNVKSVDSSELNTINDKPSSVPSTYTNQNVQNSYKTGYKGAVDGYKDGIAINSGGTPNANYNQGSAQATYTNSYAEGNAQGKQQAGANDYVANNVNQNLQKTDNNYATGVQTAEQGHTDGYAAAKNNGNTTTNSTDKTYVTGFNSGVSDQRSDAQKSNDMGAFFQGAEDYILNRPQASVNGKDFYYLTYYQQGYKTAQQGLKDARDGKEQTLPVFQTPSNKNDNSYVNSQDIINQFTAQLQSAYRLGYAAFNNGSSKDDVLTALSDADSALQNGTAALSAKDTNKTFAYNVAADIFNSELASLQHNAYSNSQDTTGTLYNDLKSWFNPKAQADYQAGESVAQKTTVAPTTDNNTPQISFGFIKAGFNDLTNGYNGSTGNNVNTHSVGYKDGQNQKQNLNTGINTAIQPVQNNTPSDSDQLDAYNGTKAGYMDRATGSTTGSSSITPQYDKVFVDAYNKAYSDGANLASEALQQLKQNQTASGVTLNADGAKNVAYTAAYNQVMDGYHDTIGLPSSGKTATTNANYSAGQGVGTTFLIDYDQAESKKNPQYPADSTSETYHGVVDALSNAATNGQIPKIQNSPNGTLYVDGYNRAVAQLNQVAKDAQYDFANGNAASPTRESTSAMQAAYIQAYNQATEGFKQAINTTNTSAPANTNASSGFNLGATNKQGYLDAITDFNSGITSTTNRSETGYADAMQALVDAKSSKYNNTDNSSVYTMAYSQALGTNNGLTNVKANPTIRNVPSAGSIPSNVNQTAYQNGYQGSVDGYQDGVASTQGTSTNKNKYSYAQGNNSIYQNAYSLANASGRQQAGANDYTAGTFSQSEAAIDSNYAKGGNSAANGYTDGVANRPPKSSQDLTYLTGYTQGQQSGSGVSQAQQLNSTDNGLTGDQLNAYYGVKDAYATVKSTNTSTLVLPSNGKDVNKTSNAYVAAFNAATQNAKKSELDGLAYFQKGNTTAPQPSNNPETIDDDARQDGFTQGSTGYSKAQSNSFDSTNQNIAYINGDKMYSDIQAGIRDAQADPTKIGQYSSGSAARDAAYDGTAGAYNDVLNNTPNSASQPKSRDQNQTKAYVDAYNQSNNTAITDGNNGALAYVRGQNQAIGNDADSQAFNYGYNQAQNGFSAGLAKLSAQNPSNTAYMTGYNAYQSENAGNIDAVNGNTVNQSSVQDSTSYQDALNAYRDAYTQLSQNPDATTLPNMTGKSPAYQNAYSVAMGELKNDYQIGYQALASSVTQNTSVPAGSNSYSTSMRTKGLNNATVGYGYGVLSQNVPSTYKNSGSLYGQQQGQLVVKAANDIANTGTGDNSLISNQIYNIAALAAGDAKNAFDANPDTSDVAGGISVNPNNNNTVYPTAYKLAVDAMKAKYNAGAQQYLSSQAESANPTKEYDMGYQDARNGFNSGFTGANLQNNHSQTLAGQTAGQNALAGYTDARNGVASSTYSNVDSNKVDGNNGATQAYADISAGKGNILASYTNASNAFQAAYNKAAVEAKPYYANGANAYVNGDSNTNATDPLSKVQSAGYLNAQNGHDAVVKNKTSENDLTQAQKNDPSFMIGFNNATQGQTGLASAGSNTPVSQETYNSWSQSQKDGYDATNAAYATGKDDNQKANLDGKSQAYKDAYNAAYEDAQDKASQGAANVLSGQHVDTSTWNTWNDKQKDAYTTGQANANSAYSTAETNTKASNPYPSGTDQAETFNGAQSAVNDIISGQAGQSKNNDSNPVYQAAYDKAQQQAQDKVNDGVTAFTKNQANVTNDNTADSVAQKYGYTQADAGYNGKTGAGINTNDPAYQAGRQLRNDENTGVSAAQQSTGKDDTSFKPANDSQKAAYDAAMAGILDGAKNNTSGQTVPQADSAQAKVYTDAYTTAHALGIQYASDGANAFNDGQANTKDKSLLGQAQSQGYTDAQKGHDAAVNKQTLTADEQNNPSFMAGYNAAQSARTGLADIESGATTPSTHEDDKAYDQAQKAYRDAAQSIADNPDSPAPTTNTSPAYKEIYNQAKNDLKSKYDAGQQQFLNAQSSADTSSSASQQGKDRISQGYADAQTGFNAAINGQTITNPNAAQKAGMDAAKTLTDAVKATVNGSYQNSDNKVAQAANSATDAARSYLLSNPDSTGSTNPDIVNNPVKAAAYKQAQTQYKENYDNGSTAFLSNQSKPAQNDALGQLGYNNALEGFEAGFNGTTMPNQNSATKTGQTAGQSALSGYQQAMKSTDSTYSVPANAPQTTKDAASGVQQAFNDAKNGTKMTKAELATKPVAFQAAYNKAIDDAKAAVSTGANAFANGSSRPVVTDAKTKAQADAYDDAQSGYNLAKSGQQPSEAQSHDASFMAGYTAYQNAQTGHDLFVSGGKLTGNETEAEKLAYQAARDAYQSGANNETKNKDLTQQSGIYQDEYNKAYDDANSKALSGAKEAFGNASSTVDQSGWTQAQKDAYKVGQTNAKAGYDQTKGDVDAQNTNAQGSNAAEAFDGAKAGFADGKSGATTDLTNKTETFINAYNAAKQEAKQAAESGAAEFNANQLDTATANAKDAINVAHSNGYNQAQAGYTAQNNGNVDQSNKDSSYLAGVKTAQAVAKGSSDALTDPSKKNSYNSGSAAQDAAYKATVNGYLDGSNGNNANAQSTDRTQSKAYDDAYLVAQQKGRDAASAGAGSYLDGNNKPTGTSAENLAQQKGYEDASKGYSDANNSSATIPEGATQAYKDGFNANKSGQAGISDIENGTTTTPADTTAYTKAQQAYDAASKAISANPDKPAGASDNSPVYQDAYSKAVTDLKQNYATGKDQFISGNKQADTSVAVSSQAKSQIEQGYKDIQRGFNDKINNATTQNANSTTQDGAEMAQKVINSVNGVATGDVLNSDDSIVQTANAAAQQAKQDLQSNPDHSTTSDDPNIQNNPIKAAAYQVAVNQMHQQYTDGSNAYLNNQAQPTTTLGDKGYTDAQSGFSAGFNGTTTPNQSSATVAGQKAGKEALAGYQSALDGKQDNSGTAMQQQANAAANQAFEDAKQNKTSDISNQPKVSYQLAYEKAMAAAQVATTSGAKAFTDGDTEPTGDKALDKVSQVAYEAAKSGYEAARDGSTITSDEQKNPSFQAGVTAYHESIQGHDLYVSGQKLPDNASAAEKAGYEAAKSAYTIGQNDGDKPTDLSSKSETYNDVFNNAYNDAKAKAQAGANEAFDNTTPVSQDGWTQAQKDAYAAGRQNAQTAYDDTKSDDTKNNPNVPGTDAANAFDGAKAGFKAGATGITPADVNDHPSGYMTAYQKAQSEAQAQAHQAQIDFAKGQNDQSTDSNGALNQAYKSAYAQFKDGYNDQKNGNVDSNNNDINYIQGIENAKQLANGIKDATDNPKNNGTEYKSTPAQEAAYNATLNGYTDGANGNSANQTPTDPSQTVIYNDAYAAAKAQAKIDAGTGATAFNNGSDKPTGSDSHAVAQQKGYIDAKGGYDYAKDNPTADLPANPTDAYKAGYNAFHSSQTGLSDAENNTSTNHADSTAYQNAQSAYADASNAIASNPDSPASAQEKAPAYVDAYTQAIKDLKANYQTGLQQFNSGANSADTSVVTSQQAKDRLTQGYEQTKAGFDSVTEGPAIDHPTAAQQAGIDSAHTVQNAVSGIVNNNTDTNNQDPVYLSATAAAQQAKNDLVNNPGHSTSSDNADIQNNPIKRAAYKQAIEAMQVQYTQGANAFVNNQGKPSDKLGQDGYDDAQEGFNEGFAGTKVAESENSGTQTGNKYGLSALSGYTDAYNGKVNNDTDDAPRNEANKAALQAFDDAKTGNTPDLSDKSLAYQTAYKKAQEDASQALLDGAKDFANGQSSPAVTNAPSGVAAKAYADALAGYQAAANGGNYTEAQKDNPQFMVGVTAYNDMVSGRQLFTSGGQLTGKESASEKAGYQAAQAAFATGKNDEPKDPSLSGQSVQYQDAYNNAYDSAKQIATSGANDAYATSPSTDTSKLSSTELDAYNAGKQNAENAYNAISGDTTIANNNIANSDAYNSFEGAKAGFIAGKTGNDTSLDGKSTAYINAYKSAKAQAAQAAAEGLAQFNANQTDTATNSNDAINVAHKNAYNQAQAGYNAQNSGNVDKSNNDASYLAGAKTAKDVQTGYSDAKTNPSRAVYNGTPAQVAAYYATVNGFHDGSYGTNNSTSTDATQAKAYADAYQKATADGATAALQGANTYNAGGAKSDDSNASGLAAQKGYEDAKQGHDDAIANQQAPENASSAYQAGAQAVSDGKRGATDFNGQKDANANYSSSNTNVQTGHDGAKDGYTDAINGANKKSFDTNSDKTQAYQDQYSLEYDKALTKASLGAQNQFTKTNTDMTGWTQSDINAYQYGQANASQGYDEARQNPDNTSHTGTTNIDESFKGAAAAFNDVKNGEEGQNDTAETNPVYQDAYQVALNAAKQVANNGATSFGNGQTLSDQLAKLGDNQADKNAFTKGYNDAQSAYAQAQQTSSQTSPYANGTNSNLVFEAAQNAFSDVKNGEAGAQANKISDPAYQAAYQKALNEVQPVATNGASGFSKGVDLQQQLATFGDNQAQKDAYTKGYNDAQTAYAQALQNANDGADHDTSSNGDETYRGAAAALLDVKNGTVGKNATAEQSGPYRDAYAKALAQAQVQSNAGATAFGNKADLNSSLAQFGNNQALSDAFTKGYNDANDGYNDAQKDANMASTHSTNGDKDEVYRGAADAFNEVSRTGDATADPSQTNAAYLASFNRAKDQAMQIAQAAAAGFSKGTTQQELISAQGDNKALQNEAIRGYIDAQAAYAQAELQPDTTTHLSDTNADKTFHGASLAFNDVKSGQDGNSRPADSDPVAQSAYDKALSAAQGLAKNGSTAFIKASSLENALMAAGNNQADKDAITKGYNDAQTAYEAAQQNPTATNPYAANTNSNLVFAAVANAIADVKANNIGAQAKNSTDPVYVDAYQRALNEAQPQATNGATGFGQGVNLADELAKLGNNQVQKDAYNRGYTDAQNAYAQALQNANDGANHASTSNGDEVYRGAAAALLDVKNGTAGQNANAEQSAPFRAAYAKALQAAQVQASAGATAFGNKADLNSSLDQFGNNQALKDAFTTGYTDANNGFNQAQVDASKASDHASQSNQDATYRGAADAFNAVAQDKNAQPDASETNPAYVAAFNRAKDLSNQLAQSGAVGFNQGKAEADLLAAQGNNDTLKKEISRGYSDAQTAYGQAKSQPDTDSRQTDTNADQTFHGSSLAFNDVKLGQAGNSRPSDSDVVAQSAYDKALSEAMEILRSGMTGYLNATSLSDLLDRVGDDQASRDAITKGYDDAQAAYAQAQQNPSQTSPYPSNSNNDLVFKAVVNAITDVKNGNSGAQANASSDSIYVDAYQKAIQAAQPETVNGATGFGNDVNLDNQLATFGNNQAQRDAYTKGYSDAQNGYNLALQNANDGVNHTSNSNEDSVYRGAAAALSDIKNGNPGQYANAEQGAPYKAAYAKALAYASQTAKNASVTYLQNGSLNDSLGQFGNNQSVKDIFTKGYNDAKTGIELVQLGTDQLASHNNNTNVDNTYRGSVLALIDINSNRPNNHLNDSTDPVFVAAYQREAQIATQAANNGAKAYTEGLTESAAVNKYSATPEDVASIKMGYEQSQTGYGDGNTANAQSKSDNPYYQVGFNYADSAYKGYQSAQSNGNQTPTGNVATDDAYQATVAASSDVKKGVAKQDVSGKSLAYQTAYGRAYDQFLAKKKADQESDFSKVGKKYYKKNYKLFRVINKYGARVYTSPKFTKKNWVITLKQGDLFKAVKIVRHNKTTRFYVGNGDYITANKDYVEATQLAKKDKTKKTTKKAKTTKKKVVKKVKPVVNTKPTKKKVVKKTQSTKKPTVAKTHKTINKQEPKKNVKKTTAPVIKKKQTIKHPGYSVTLTPKGNSRYYRKNYTVFRLQKGALIHTDKTFNEHNWVSTLRRNDVIRVQNVVKFHGITRFYLGSGRYVTSNKEFVVDENTYEQRKGTKAAKSDRVANKPLPNNLSKYSDAYVQAYLKEFYQGSNAQVIFRRRDNETKPVTSSKAKHDKSSYYHENYKVYKVIAKNGVRIHTDLKFNANNWIAKLQQNNVFKVKKVVKYYGITRLYIGDSEYITANKNFVKRNDD